MTAKLTMTWYLYPAGPVTPGITTRPEIIKAKIFKTEDGLYKFYDDAYDYPLAVFPTRHYYVKRV